MAEETWSILAEDVQLVGDVFNVVIGFWLDTTNPAMIKVRRIYLFNAQTSAIDDGYVTMRIFRTDEIGSGTSIQPFPYDTNNRPLPPDFRAQHTASYGSELTVFRQFLWYVKEIGGGGRYLASLELLIPFAEVWNAGYGDPDVQPIIIRQLYGCALRILETSPPSGRVTAEMEFTYITP